MAVQKKRLSAKLKKRINIVQIITDIIPVSYTHLDVYKRQDHGNCEQLIDYETGEPYTAHTTNPVPFILVNYDPAYTLREGGCLADIAPTLIEMMGMEQPKEMTGKSLLIKK